MQKTIAILFVTFFHTYLFGNNDNLVEERLRQRLKSAKDNFNLEKHRRLKYKLAARALHGPIRMASKECPIYYESNTSDDINCEHIVPQSFFQRITVISSDLHHIYPAYKSINSIRGNCKFAEIPDEEAEFIYLTGSDSPAHKDTSTCKISKRDTFEPNDKSKGKVARACAYFFTRYPSFLPKMSQVIDIYVVKWDRVNTLAFRRTL